MTRQQITDLILQNGTVHQQYIVMRDILGMKPDAPKMEELQERVVRSRQVQKILKHQDENGWIGFELHGGVGTALDASVGCLIEDLGVEPENPAMQKAKKALLANANPDPRGKNEYNGDIRGYPFSKCAILGQLHTGGETEEVLTSAFMRILEIFDESSRVQSLDEVSKLCTRKKYIGHRAYLPGKVFVWISDIIVLSTCLGWKTPEAESTVIRCLQNVARFMPIPVIFEVIKGYYLAPVCGYAAFSCPDCTELPKGEIVWWFRDFSRMCKICRIQEIPYFYRQAEQLREDITKDTFIGKLRADSLAALEKSNPYRTKWRTEAERKTDIYFKALRLLDNAGIDF